MADRRRWALRPIAVATLAVVSCGGSDEASAGVPSALPSAGGVVATAYVEDVCGGFVDWMAEIRSLTQELGEAGTGASTVEELKDAAVSYFVGLVAATDSLISDVEAAGVPTVPQGAEAAQHVLDSLADIRQAMQDSQEQVETLATDGGPQAFARELRAITADMAETLTRIGTSMADFEAPELDAASEETAICDEVAA